MLSAFQKHTYADVETSSPGYAARFSGPHGTWFLDVQLQVALKLLSTRNGLGATESKHILDIGGGHGQIAKPLSEKGFKVTVCGSSKECALFLKDFLVTGENHFFVGDLLSLPIEDQSFEIVTCFRLLSHCKEWRTLVAELCRLSSHSVLIDYPPLISFNLLYPLLFHVKKKLEGNTREFLIFTHREIEKEFALHGFSLAQRRSQFFFPMVVHRTLKNKRTSSLMESLFAHFGLSYLFGSPTIAYFVRNQ